MKTIMNTEVHDMKKLLTVILILALLLPAASLADVSDWLY